MPVGSPRAQCRFRYPSPGSSADRRPESHRDRRRLRIDRILQKLLDNRRLPFNDLAGCNLIDCIGIQDLNRSHLSPTSFLNSFYWCIHRFFSFACSLSNVLSASSGDIRFTSSSMISLMISSSLTVSKDRHLLQIHSSGFATFFARLGSRTIFVISFARAVMSASLNSSTSSFCPIDDRSRTPASFRHLDAVALIGATLHDFTQEDDIVAPFLDRNTGSC